ncbi:hypothetical protein AJ80_06685 [Polytolypa hystricis UAMH7299]|uniref:NAD-dependent protein deacetylase n=1 Tax=Polytolypa hystricis (strain UAMH7299) TaxID=1447883 RepID=A0A2B7XLA3_POLH7|nr:hypothetical protein AJ80_06685 [Polytolypa hystricis UAMH7299]
MGNDNSAMIDDGTPPKTLESRSVEGIAKYIKEKDVKSIVVLTGAGISTSAGIPDFRSPDTGLYANLAKLKLPNPEAVFDISFFRKNPHPFYALAREMFPGRHRPTITHCFIKLLYDKGRLLKLFTQNIDCLEREAGLPGEMIVEAHGSFASHSCIECKTEYSDELMRKALEANDIPLCPECMGLVKPNIVFFGESLPRGFFVNRTLTAAADLCIIMGTSLTVQPFASLPGLCAEGTPRLLINLTRAGGLGSRPDDVLMLSECDKGVMELAEALGWLEDLQELWARVNPEKANAMAKSNEGLPKTRDEQLHDKVNRLTDEVEHTLQTARRIQDLVNSELELKHDKEQTTEGQRTSEAATTMDGEATRPNKNTHLDALPTQLEVQDKADTTLEHVFPHLKLEDAAPGKKSSL